MPTDRSASAGSAAVTRNERRRVASASSNLVVAPKRSDVSSNAADLQTEQEFKYSPEVEKKVRAWIAKVLDEELPDDDFHQLLKSG